MTPEQVKQDVLKHYPELTLIYRVFNAPHEKTLIGIDFLGLPKQSRGEGQGSRALHHLTYLADQYEMVLAATPTNLFGSDVQRLTTFLQSYGFERSNANIHRGYSMIRWNNYQNDEVSVVKIL